MFIPWSEHEMNSLQTGVNMIKVKCTILHIIKLASIDFKILL